MSAFTLSHPHGAEVLAVDLAVLMSNNTRSFTPSFTLYKFTKDLFNSHKKTDRQTGVGEGRKKEIEGAGDGSVIKNS